MVKCPVFNYFCCCCPLKVIITICIFNNVNINIMSIVHSHKISILKHLMKVGALIIGLVYLIVGLIMGLLCTVIAATLKPETLEDMDGVVKISEGQVQNSGFV